MQLADNGQRQGVAARPHDYSRKVYQCSQIPFSYAYEMGSSRLSFLGNIMTNSLITSIHTNHITLAPRMVFRKSPPYTAMLSSSSIPWPFQLESWISAKRAILAPLFLFAISI